ncbi:MAG: STAS domain-containing protein [Burkholderiaceae bacterium]
MSASSNKLTTPEVNAFLETTRAQIASGQGQVDLSKFSSVDSAAVAALLALKRDSDGPGPQFLNPTENLRKLAVLYGVDAILFPT